MFTGNDLQDLLKRRPFSPFRIILSDGSQVEVRSPEVALAGRRFAVIGLLDPDATNTFFDRWTVVWYMHVTRVEMVNPGAPPFASPPGAAESPTPTSG